MPRRKPAGWCALCVFAAFTPLIGPCKADVPTPPTPPPPPAGYCTTIYSELSGDLTAFATILQTPPVWTPVGPANTVYSANLQSADGNTGTGLISTNYIASVTNQLQELQALGIQGVMVQVGFPVLYAPFFGGETELQPYLTFYSQVAQAVRNAGLKLIVENDVLLADDIQGNWPNLNSFYSSSTFTNPVTGWSNYMAARATMAATVAQTMQPDFLVLAEEPDGEAKNSGQGNMGNPADAAVMITGEIAAVRALNLPNMKLGAGFGSWTPASVPLVDYIGAYVALPLDYIDFHIYPINTENGDSYIGNTLVIAQAAASAGLPVAMSEGWLWKMEDSEYAVFTGDYFRGRNPFSFWGTLDAGFLDTVYALGQYAKMFYVSPEQADYLFAYQTYGGTVANGGAATCNCTTESCSDYAIVHTENSLAGTANANADYSSTGFAYNSVLVQPPDTIPPSTPTITGGGAGYTNANISWAASTDNVGVAGYNVFRCQPPAEGQPCTGVQIGQTSSTMYIDDGPLTSATPYNYQVQAFDLANNNSQLSNVFSTQTLRVSASSPTGLTATPISAKEIDLSWTPPTDNTGLTHYVIFAGSSSSNLTQIATIPSSMTTYRDLNLQAATAYFFGVEAVESGVDSAMTQVVKAVTLPLPNPPSDIVATPAPTSIAITWQENPPVNGLAVNSYQIWESESYLQLTKVATVKSTSYTERSLTPNTTYYYEIIAVDADNDDSPPLGEFAVTTLPGPPPPTDLQATTPAATQIAFTWQWAQGGGLQFARFLVDCGTTQSPTEPQAGVTTAGPPFAYTWRDAKPSTTYYCQVVAVDQDNNDSQPSSQIKVTTPTLPSAPVDITATAIAATKVTVTWTENNTNGLGIANYTVLYGTSPSALSSSKTATGSPYTVTGLSPNMTYYFAVEATDTGRDVSPMSAVKSATTLPLPSTPTNVTPTANSFTQVTVTWTENNTNGVSIKNYSVFRGPQANMLAPLGTTPKTSYTDTSVVASTTYYYAVQATDTEGDPPSPMSAVVPVTTPAP